MLARGSRACFSARRAASRSTTLRLLKVYRPAWPSQYSLLIRAPVQRPAGALADYFGLSTIRYWQTTGVRS
eukprot:903438-Prymnesium_polylepis.1